MSLLSDLRAAIAAKSTENGEKNAVTRLLRQHGWRGVPKVIQERDNGQTVRNYVYAGAADGEDVVLATGPSRVGEVHIVAAGAKAPVHTAPQPQATGGSAARHQRVLMPNPPKGPQKKDLAAPDAYSKQASDTFMGTLMNEITANSHGMNATMAGSIVRFYIREAAGVPTKVFRVKKGGSWVNPMNVYINHADKWIPSYAKDNANSIATDAQADAIRKVMGMQPESTQRSYSPTLSSIPYKDPYADYSGGSGPWTVPGAYVEYVSALIASTAKANNIPLSAAGESILANSKGLKKGGYGKSTSKTKGTTPVTGSKGKYATPGTEGTVTFHQANDGEWTYVDGDTFGVKGIFKVNGFKWSGKSGASYLKDVPKQVWYTKTAMKFVEDSTDFVGEIIDAGWTVSFQGAQTGSTTTPVPVSFVAGQKVVDIADWEDMPQRALVVTAGDEVVIRTAQGFYFLTNAAAADKGYIAAYLNGDYGEPANGGFKNGPDGVYKGTLTASIVNNNDVDGLAALVNVLLGHTPAVATTAEWPFTLPMYSIIAAPEYADAPLMYTQGNEWWTVAPSGFLGSQIQDPKEWVSKDHKGNDVTTSEYVKQSSIVLLGAGKSKIPDDSVTGNIANATLMGLLPNGDKIKGFDGAQMFGAEAAKLYLATVADPTMPAPQMAAVQATPKASPPKAGTGGNPPQAAYAGPYSIPMNPVWAEGVAAICGRLVYSMAKPGGSVPGHVAVDPVTKQRYLVKYPKTADHVANEVLAAQLYRYFGAYAHDARGAAVDGKWAVVTPFIESAMVEPSFLSPKMHRYIACTILLDIWFANYDVYGADGDNIATNANLPGAEPLKLEWGGSRWKNTIRLDVGAALRYRAQGTKKPNYGAKSFGSTETSLVDSWTGLLANQGKSMHAEDSLKVHAKAAWDFWQASNLDVEHGDPAHTTQEKRLMAIAQWAEVTDPGALMHTLTSRRLHLTDHLLSLPGVQATPQATKGPALAVGDTWTATQTGQWKAAPMGTVIKDKDGDFYMKTTPGSVLMWSTTDNNWTSTALETTLPPTWAPFIVVKVGSGGTFDTSFNPALHGKPPLVVGHTMDDVTAWKTVPFGTIVKDSDGDFYMKTSEHQTKIWGKNDDEWDHASMHTSGALSATHSPYTIVAVGKGTWSHDIDPNKLGTPDASAEGDAGVLGNAKNITLSEWPNAPVGTLVKDKDGDYSAKGPDGVTLFWSESDGGWISASNYLATDWAPYSLVVVGTGMFNMAFNPTTMSVPTAQAAPPAKAKRVATPQTAPVPEGPLVPIEQPGGSKLADKDGDEWMLLDGVLKGWSDDVLGLEIDAENPKTVAAYGPWTMLSTGTGAAGHSGPTVAPTPEYDALDAVPDGGALVIDYKTGKLYIKKNDVWLYVNLDGSFADGWGSFNAKSMANQIKNREGGGSEAYLVPSLVSEDISMWDNVAEGYVKLRSQASDAKALGWTRLHGAALPVGSAAAPTWSAQRPEGPDGTIATAFALITSGDYVLLAKRSRQLSNSPEAWGFPGGAIESGENVVTAAIRESEEELGKLPKLKDTGVRISVEYPKVFATTVVFTAAKHAVDSWRANLNDASHKGETQGWAWVHKSELHVKKGQISWRPKLHHGVSIPSKNMDASVLALWKDQGTEWEKNTTASADDFMAAFESDAGLNTEGFSKLFGTDIQPKVNPSGHALSGVRYNSLGEPYIEYRPRLPDGTRPRVQVAIGSLAAATEQIAQEFQQALRADEMGQKFPKKALLSTLNAFIVKGEATNTGKAIWPTVALEGFVPLFSRILGKAKIKRGDIIQLHNTLEAVGLPILKVTPAVEAAGTAAMEKVVKELKASHAKELTAATLDAMVTDTMQSPTGKGGMLTTKQEGAVMDIYDAAIKAFGQHGKPETASDPAWAKKLAAEATKKLQALKGPSNQSPEVGRYLRALAAGRAAGIWPEVLDPGARIIYTGTGWSMGDSGVDKVHEARVIMTGASDDIVSKMHKAGKVSFPNAATTAQYQETASAWIRHQRDLKPQPPSSIPASLTDNAMNNWGNINVKGVNAATGTKVGKSPSKAPAWADKEWANVEGFPVHYRYGSKIRANEVNSWASVPFGVSHNGSNSTDGSYQQNHFLLRANTADYAGFIMVPTRQVNGGSDGYLSEAQVSLVDIGTSFPAQIVHNIYDGSNYPQKGQAKNLAKLTPRQINAYSLARPPYGPKWAHFDRWEDKYDLKANPSIRLKRAGDGVPDDERANPRHNPVHRNPRASVPRETRIQTLLFDMDVFDNDAALEWAEEHGFKSTKVDVQRRYTRVRQERPSSFFSDTFRTISIADGVKAVVAVPRG